MSLEENKALVERYVEELYNKGNFAVIGQFIATDIVFHDPPVPDLPPGIEGVRHIPAFWRTAFPDLHITNDDLVAEEDTVVQRFTMRGTHTGDMLGIPPTGKPVTMEGFNFLRIADGKIVERWGIADTLSALQQIGVIPPPEQPKE